MLDDQRPGWLTTAIGQQDLMAKALKVGLSACGPVGAIVGEFITEFVPAQRMDRLQDFVEQLADRVAGHEAALHQRLQDSAAFAAFAEEVHLTAAKSASAQRRKDLAELLRIGLSRDDAQLVGHQAVLRLLDQLNDVQLLILMRYGSFRRTYIDEPLRQFIEQHADVFVEPLGIGDDDPEKYRRWTMFRHYEDAMERLGLLKDLEGVAKASAVMRSLEITELGYLVLEAVGRPAIRR